MDCPLVRNIGGVNRRTSPKFCFCRKGCDFGVLEHVTLGSGHEQVNDTATVYNTAEGNGERVGNGKSGGGIFIGDNAAIVDTGETRHHVCLDGQDMALCTAQCIVAGRGDCRSRSTLIPLNRGHRRRGDLVGGSTDNIQARREDEVGTRPVGIVGVVIGVEHLRLGVV